MPDFDTTGMKLLRDGVWLDPRNGVVHASIADICAKRGLPLNRETDAMVRREIQQWFREQSPTAPIISGTGEGVRKVEPENPAPIRMLRCKCADGHDLAGVAYEKCNGISHAIDFLVEIISRTGVTSCRQCGSRELHLEDMPSDFESMEEAMQQFQLMAQPAN